MSNFIIVFVLLCALQQGFMFPNTLNAKRRSLSNLRNPTVGSSLNINTPAIQPVSRSDIFQGSDFRKKFRDLAQHSNGKSSGAHLGTIRHRLHNLSNKSVSTHTLKPYSKITPNVRNVDKKKRLNKVKKHQNKILSSRSGLVDNSGDVTHKPLTLNSGTNSKIGHDDHNEGAGIVVQPKTLY